MLIDLQGVSPCGASFFPSDGKETNGPGRLPPLEGEGLWAAPCGRPYADTGTRAHTVRPCGGKRAGSLVRQSQAQEWNRTSPNFPPTQAPSGAGRNSTQALLILRAGRILPASRGNPRKWGTGGKPSLANGVRLCGVPRRSFGFFPIAGKETRPAGRNPA